MLNDWFRRLSAWLSYCFFCLSNLKAFCLTEFLAGPSLILDICSLSFFNSPSIRCTFFLHRLRSRIDVCYAVVQVGSRSFGLPCSKEPVHDGQEGWVAATNECLALMSLVGFVVLNAKEI